MFFRFAGKGSVHQANLGLMFFYAAATGAAWRLRDPDPNHWAIAVALALVAYAWFANLRRYRLIADHPTSRVVSAPQGYVELHGQASGEDGFQLIAPLSQRSCVWFRYVLERRQGDKWVREESGESHDHMLLLDGSGRCLVDPDGAEIHSSHYKIWTEGNYRNTEWLIQSGDPLYVIGDHHTLGGANSDLDLRSDLSALLAEWKRDPAELLTRFDADRNGQIDAQEWQQAQREAERQITAQHREIRSRDGVHVMRRPQHGRLYLVANQSPQKLARHYRVWSWAHLTLILGGGIFLLMY